MRIQSKIFVFVIIASLLLLTVLQAQNVEFQLGGKTNAEKFEIKDSDGNVLFQLKGNGKIGLGSAVLKSSKMHVQGSINVQGVYKLQGKTILSIPGLYNTIVGEDAGINRTSGNHNTFAGARAGESNTTGNSNVFVGADAGYDNTTGHDNAYMGHSAGAWGNGNYNTYVGNLAGNQGTAGNLNTFVGHSSGFYTGGNNNTFIGYNTGWNNSSGNGNIFIGHEAGANTSGSNKLFIDNSNTDSPLIWGGFVANRIVINGNSTHNSNNRTFFVNGAAGGTGAWNNDSDGRMKKNITTIDQALEKVRNLRGVNFEWKETENHEEGLQMGFIAQEVEEVIPEVVSNGGDSYSMQYSPLTALLVEAMKEQQNLIESQQLII
ncbi:MAG: tail fiber domain-containing protein, partial [Candidatus Hodarchaeales archaeon]